MKVYRALSIPNLCVGKYVEEYDTDSFCDVWVRIVVRTLREATESFAEFLNDLSENDRSKIDLVDRIMFLTDMYTWLLKSPVYLDPIREIIHSPYKIYVYERIRLIAKNVNSGLPDNFIDMITKYCRENIESSEEYNGNPVCKLARKIIDLADYMRNELGRENIDWKKILEYPADTRPGYNSTSLIVHSILVSAMSWAIALENEYSREKAALYALAGLLHDMGKPCDPTHHVSRTKDLIERELGKSLKSILGEPYYQELMSIIEKHHAKEEIIAKADKLAARERSNAFVERILLGELKEKVQDVCEKLSNEEKKKYEAICEDPRYLYEGFTRKNKIKSKPKSRTKWNFWGKIDPDKVKELTQIYARETWGIELLKHLDETNTRRKTGDKHVYTLLLDIGGIQQIIDNSLDLRIMAVNSYLIDVWLMSELPIHLYSSYNIPLSALVINSGGNSLIILPKSIAPNVKNDIEEKFNKLNYAHLELTINTAIQPFNPDYQKLYSSLVRQLHIAKRTQRLENIVVHPGISNSFCDFCGVKPAQTIIKIGEEEKRVCLECRIRHYIADDIVYTKAKKRFFDKHKEIYEREKNLLKTDPASKVNREIYRRIFNMLIEYISGLPSNEEYHCRLLNYSVISIDGNLMGFYMSLSPTFTSAIEKGLLIEYSFKKAYSEFIDRVINVLEKEISTGTGYLEASRLVLGYLYMGGDDARLVVPTHLAIPLSIYLAKRFHELTNCTMTLSIGIASGPTKHHIWGLNNTSKGLIKEFAKPDGRKATYQALRGEKPTYAATLQLYNTESTSMLTIERVSEFYNRHLGGNNGTGLVLERYTITPEDVGSPENLYWILDRISKYLDPNISSRDLIDRLISLGYRLIVNQCQAQNKEKMEKCLQYYLGNRYTKVPDNVSKPLSRLRKLRSAVNEALSIYEKYKDTGESVAPVILYLKRQIVRRSKNEEVSRGKETEYNILLDLLPGKRGKENMQSNTIAPLLSYLILVKTIGGGVL